MKFPKLVECKSVPCHLPEGMARNVDDIIANLPKEKAYDFRRKSAVIESKEIDVYERCDISYITTPSIDRDHEVVRPDGMDISIYDTNRIVLWNHDQNKPCGKCMWVKPDGVNGILAKTYYPGKPDGYEGDWLPETIWGFVQVEMLRGKSVGFVPLELAEPDEELRNKGCELVITKSLLLEYSVVSIPCNHDSIVQGINKGLAVDFFAGMKRTGQKVKPKVKKVKKIDRTPQFVQAIMNMSIDTDAIAERVIHALKNRGRI